MSRVIIFCGLPASGKTTLAKEVSKRLNMFCLHKDALKERFYESLGGNSLEDSKKIGKAVIETIVTLGEDAIQNGIDIILESPFNHVDNPKQFEIWVREYNVELFVVICSINEDEREKRYVSRARHPGHHDQERLNHYPFYADTFDYSVMPGRKLFLTTDTVLEESVQRVMDFLKEE